MDNPSRPNPGHTIGQVAAAAGVNVETVRYYQRRGLIDAPTKPARGCRRYTHAVVERIRFIKRAQRLGFRLLEISELLELGTSRCEDVRRRAEFRRDEIDQQIRELAILRRTLDHLIGACRDDPGSHHCPIVENLLEREAGKPDDSL